MTSPRFNWIYLLLCLPLVLAMGTAAPTPVPTESNWGAVQTLGQAEQTHAPAAGWINDTVLVTIWIAADETGAYHYARAINSRRFTDVQRLPIAPVFPRTQTLIAAGDNSTHLFWLDIPPNDTDTNTYLWGALLDTSLTLTRGAIQLADDTVYHYDAIPGVDGDALLVWSEGRRDEPRLMARLIDGQGRPRNPVELTTNAAYPRIIPATGGYRLFWLDNRHEIAYTAFFDGTSLGEVEQAASLLFMQADDRLAGFQVGADASTTYLFWQVQTADGTVQTWYAYHTDIWTTPTPLHVSVNTTQPFVTGYNGGDAYTAQSGRSAVQWASPLQDRPGDDLLPVAAQIDTRLGVLYLRHGEIVAWQPVVDLDTPGLIGSPFLLTNRARHLYLLWAQPTDAGYANLNLTSTAILP